MMSQVTSPSSRSNITLSLRDFIKRDFNKKSRNKNKSSPDNQRSRTVFNKENCIDFSVNDIEFEKVQKKRGAMKELKWSENDVDFSSTKTCSYRKCLQNDENIRPFNSFRVPYSSDESDINFNNEHFFLPEFQQLEDSSTSYFSFDRVEDAGYFGQEPEYFYQGTTYYSLDEQVNNLSSSSISNITDNIGVLDITEENQDSDHDDADKSKELENDEELNNIVISIIDD